MLLKVYKYHIMVLKFKDYISQILLEDENLIDFKIFLANPLRTSYQFDVPYKNSFGDEFILKCVVEFYRLEGFKWLMHKIKDTKEILNTEFNKLKAQGKYHFVSFSHIEEDFLKYLDKHLMEISLEIGGSFVKQGENVPQAVKTKILLTKARIIKDFLQRNPNILIIKSSPYDKDYSRMNYRVLQKAGCKTTLYPKFTQDEKGKDIVPDNVNYYSFVSNKSFEELFDGFFLQY